MRWDDERYVRLYTRDTPEWSVLDWEARAVFYELLRKVDRAGVVALGKTRLRGLAGLLRMPVDVVTKGVDGLLEDGCIELTDSGVIVRNFIEAQEAKQTDKARQRACRERARDTERARVSEVHCILSRGVTVGHAPSHEVTPGHSVPNRTETIQADPIRSDPIHTLSVSPEPRARASQDTVQDIHTQSAESYEIPPLPDAEWLAAELGKRPALARFADDPDLCADLAGGLQDRSRTHAQAAQIIAAFVAKEGKTARDMNAAEFQRLFGGYIVNAKLRAGAPSSEPQFPEVREALTIFAERWKATKGAARVEEADDADHAAACIEMAKKAIVASKSEARPREVYRRAVDAYLADSATWLADAQWPLRTLARKFSSYASIPTPKPRPGPAKAPEEPTMPMRRRATYAEAAAMAQGTGTRSGNMGPALALVFDRDKVSSG